MAQDQKAHSRFRPERLAPAITSNGIEEFPKKGEGSWEEEEGEIDEDNLEGAQDDFEDEQWEDDDFRTNEEVFDEEDASREGTLRYKTPAASSTAQKKSQQGKTNSKPRKQSNGLKKGSLKKAKELDMPPTPLGCEWRDAEDGWSLWRCWSERDEVIGGKYKKERYAGYLSRGAWSVMKQYDYETFIAVIGRRFRRHGGR